jgi:hypothetical protein
MKVPNLVLGVPPAQFLYKRVITYRYKVAMNTARTKKRKQCTIYCYGGDDDYEEHKKKKQDRSGRDQSGRDQSGRDQSGRDQSGRDQSGRDQTQRKKQDRSGRDPTRNKKKVVDPTLSPINRDALRYQEELHANLRFISCGICEWEGPNINFKSMDEEVKSTIRNSDVKRLYLDIKDYYESDIMDDDKPSKEYIQHWLDYFDSDIGCVLGSMWVCKGCLKTMKRGAKYNDNGLEGNDEDNDCADGEELDNNNDGEELDACNDTIPKADSKSQKCLYWHGRAYPSAPVYVMLLLYRGPVPDVLLKLNAVELSMVSGTTEFHICTKCS